MAVFTLTKENFEEEVLLTNRPVLIDFWAPWCRPCRMMEPIIETLAEEQGELLVAKLNVDEQKELAVGFGVMSIPTLVLIREGEICRVAVGLCSREEVLALLEPTEFAGSAPEAEEEQEIETEAESA